MLVVPRGQSTYRPHSVQLERLGGESNVMVGNINFVYAFIKAMSSTSIGLCSKSCPFFQDRTVLLNLGSHTAGLNPYKDQWPLNRSVV